MYHFGGSGVCIKVAKQRHFDEKAYLYNLGNTVLEEARILAHLCDLEVEGVRAPDFVEYIPGTRYGIIIMKELDAVNLQHVLNGSATLPESYKQEDFFMALESYIDEMHYEKNIVHGDLFARNIMIDRNDGLPRVIDFGRALFIDKDKGASDHIRKEWEHFDKLQELCKKSLT